MSETKKLIESIQNNLREADNSLLNAVKSILDKNAVQTKKSISAVYDNVDIWITDTGNQIKLDTKKDRGTILHTQKGNMNGPSIHLTADKSNGYISAIKNLKNQFDKNVNIEIEGKFIISIDDKYLGNDGTLVDRNEAKIYNNYDNAEHDLYSYIYDNGGKGKIVDLNESNLNEDMNDEDLKMVDRVEEATGYSKEECEQIVKNGDYVFFPGVSDHDELGKAYVDMVGISGVSNIENYIDDTEIKEGIAEYLDDIGETYTDTDLDSMAQEDINTAINDEQYDYLERYFDFERLGRDLEFQEYYFVSDGAIGIFN